MENWFLKSKATKRDLQSLIGKLVFISKCVFASRIFICRMLESLRTLKAQHHRFKLSAEFKKDLKWWSKFLSIYNGVTYIPKMVWEDPDMVVSTDACLTGCGGWCSDQYFSTKFPADVIEKSFHINVLEILTILIALRLWSKKFSGLRIKFNCDNEVSVCVINSGKSRDKMLLKVIREIGFICSTDNIQIQAIHFPGVVNRKADLLSRAPFDPGINISEIMGSSTRPDIHCKL